MQINLDTVDLVLLHFWSILCFMLWFLFLFPTVTMFEDQNTSRHLVHVVRSIFFMYLQLEKRLPIAYMFSVSTLYYRHVSLNNRRQSMKDIIVNNSVLMLIRVERRPRRAWLMLTREGEFHPIPFHSFLSPSLTPSNSATRQAYAMCSVSIFFIVLNRYHSGEHVL